MRITIIAPGSRGDVQPYLALGKGLTQAGYAVRLVTHQNFADFVKSHGVEFWPMGDNVQDVAQSQDMRALLEKGNFLYYSLLWRPALLGAARCRIGRWPRPCSAPETHGCTACTGGSTGGERSRDAPARRRTGGENPGRARCRARRGVSAAKYAVLALSASR